MESKSRKGKSAVAGMVLLTLAATVSLTGISAGGLPDFGWISSWIRVKPQESPPAVREYPGREPAQTISRTYSKGGRIMSTDVRNQPSVEHVNEATFEDRVLQSEVPVLVDFYADWCRPCQMLAPTLDELAMENPGARVVKVNVDDNPRLAARFGVSSIPALKVFRNGRVAREHVGMADKRRLTDMLTR